MPDDLLPSIEYAKYGPCEFRFNRTPTWEEAEQVAESLFHIKGSIQFWIGDFANACEKYFGEDFAQLIPEYEAESVRKFAWVARRIPPVLRRPNLSFGIHQEIAKLDDSMQDALLEKAERESLTVKQMRNILKNERSKTAKTIQCPECGYKWEP